MFECERRKNKATRSTLYLHSLPSSGAGADFPLPRCATDKKLNAATSRHSLPSPSRSRLHAAPAFHASRLHASRLARVSLPPACLYPSLRHLHIGLLFLCAQPINPIATQPTSQHFVLDPASKHHRDPNPTRIMHYRARTSRARPNFTTFSNSNISLLNTRPQTLTVPNRLSNDHDRRTHKGTTYTWNHGVTHCPHSHSCVQAILSPRSRLQSALAQPECMNEHKSSSLFECIGRAVCHQKSIAVALHCSSYTDDGGAAKGSALQSGHVWLGPPSSHVSTHPAW